MFKFYAPVNIIMLFYTYNCVHGVCFSRSYLAMAEVALALSQPSTAVQLCLAALRDLQSTDKNADFSSSQEMDENLKNLRSTSQSSFAPDLRLWLECKNILAKSLLDVKCEWLSCASVCGEGCDKCEACGDVEMWAEFQLTAAMHSLNADLPNLDLLQTHAQVSVTQQIEKYR